jgi:polyhydroxyalkanoate synthesis repressor PhaR
MIEIRKYSNRRLYDTSDSVYVKLSDVAQMIRDGKEIRVVDAKTGEDLTRTVMLQIICESKEEQEALPIGFLRQVIQASSNSVRSSIRDFLAAGMEAQKEVHHQMANWMRLGMMVNPITAPLMTAWDHLAKGAKHGHPVGPQSSTGEDRSRVSGAESEGSVQPASEAVTASGVESPSEVELLRAQLAALQQQIEALDKKP